MKPAAVLVGLSGGVKMPVNVRRLAGHMAVRVPMKLQFLARELVENTSAKANEHDGNHEFEPACNAFRQVNLEKEDEGSSHGKRQTVSGTPEQADPAASEKASFLTDERGDGHDVIGIRGVLQPKKEAQAENCN